MKIRSTLQTFLDAVRQMPGAALTVVVLGLMATALVAYANFVRVPMSTDGTWQTNELMPAAGPEPLPGNGGLSIGRAQVSTAELGSDAVALYRLSGLARIRSPEARPTTVKCRVTTLSPGSFIAQTPAKVAAWPRPRGQVPVQVPETAPIRLYPGKAGSKSIPLRDAINNYTDTTRPAKVEWLRGGKQSHGWVWTMPQGSGAGTVTFGFIVAFETTQRPEAAVECQARTGTDLAEVSTSFLQAAWPLDGGGSDSG